MKVDLYTKVVLTVIAVSLLWIGAKEVVSPLSADNATRVVVCDEVNPLSCAKVTKSGALSVDNSSDLLRPAHAAELSGKGARLDKDS
jgi:hypothetical protein